jgi:galactonate dehydratase
MGFKTRKLNVPVYELLGGKLRDKLAIYAWIGGGRPTDISAAARAQKEQGFKAIKMNATENIGWLGYLSVLDSAVDML